MNRIILALFSVVFLLPSLLLAEPASFLLEVEIAPTNGDAILVSMPHLALEIDNDAELILPVPSGEIIAEFDFSISDQFAMVEIYDPAAMEVTEKGPRGPRIASGTIAFSFGKKTPVVKSPLGAISFTLTPPKGWEATKLVPRNSSAVEALSKEDLAKLEYEAAILSDNRGVTLRIYNPTEYMVANAVVRVQAPASDQFEGLNRLYEIDSLDLDPMQDTTRSRECYSLPELPDGVSYKVTLESATARRIR